MNDDDVPDCPGVMLNTPYGQYLEERRKEATKEYKEGRALYPRFSLREIYPDHPMFKEQK